MRTALDAPVSALDRHEQKFVSIVREHGWHRMSVFEDAEGPAFSYTTGFWVKLGFPELIVISLDSKNAGDVLWDVYRDITSGRQYPVGTRIPDLFVNCDSFLLPVEKRHYRNYLGWNCWFYGGYEFPCLQLVWPDKHGAFPWEFRADPQFHGTQPDLSPDGWTKALSH